MAAGKSTIGRRLAAKLALPFVDTDDEIEAAYGLPVSAIFDGIGEAEFRSAERSLIARLLEGETQVIALGGGAFVDADNRARLNASSLTIWIDPPFELVLSRIARSARRPLASDRSESALRQLWDERQASYAHAHLRIRTSDADPQLFVEAIIAQLPVGGP